MPVSGKLYVQNLGGEGAGAVTRFGTGTAPSNFVPLLENLPLSMGAEPLVGVFAAGTVVNFAMFTTWAGQSEWAFSSATDAASLCVFSDTDNSLRMNNRVIEQKTATTWLMHLDNARSAGIDDDDNDVIIQIRIEPIAQSCQVALAPPESTLDWRGGTVNVLVLASSNCAWTAQSNSSWAQPYPLQGVGNGTVQLTVGPNLTSASRNSTVTVNGSTITVPQAASGLTYDERFVSLMYLNFLGRLPNATERAFHVASLVPRGQVTYSDLATNFLNSDEFQLGGRFVAGLYVGVLNRDAEYGGWLFQRNAIAGTYLHTQLAGNFIGSAEWTLKFGTPSNEDFVRLLYRQIMLRDGSPGEIAFQTSNLILGMSRAQLATSFLAVPEFKIKNSPRLTAFLLYATLLMRDPTDSERTARIAQLTTSADVSTIVRELLLSQDFGKLLN